MTVLLAERPVRTATADALLEGDLYLPDEPRGLIVFAHGSGSSRHNARDRHVVQRLAAEGFGTLVFDLLTRSEDAQDRRTYRFRFDTPLLSRRLTSALDWARRSPVSRHLKIGLLGAASDAGAALRVAAERTRDVAAVVLLGGRPEASRDILRRVSAPTLMLVGEKDNAVMLQSRHALDQFHGPRELSVVPGASHLFLEGDTLEVAARAASDWFARHLTPHARSAA